MKIIAVVGASQKGKTSSINLAALEFYNATTNLSMNPIIVAGDLSKLIRERNTSIIFEIPQCNIKICC